MRYVYYWDTYMLRVVVRPWFYLGTEIPEYFSETKLGALQQGRVLYLKSLNRKLSQIEDYSYSKVLKNAYFAECIHLKDKVLLMEEKIKEEKAKEQNGKNENISGS